MPADAHWEELMKTPMNYRPTSVISRGLGLFAAALLVFLATPSTAHAYLDPGSGSLLWQALIAALFGGMFYFRRFIAQVKAWIGVGRKTADSEK
jgi:hypothetical protein